MQTDAFNYVPNNLLWTCWGHGTSEHISYRKHGSSIHTWSVKFLSRNRKENIHHSIPSSFNSTIVFRLLHKRKLYVHRPTYFRSIISVQMTSRFNNSLYTLINVTGSCRTRISEFPPNWWIWTKSIFKYV